MLNLIIKGGRIIDGTGNPWYLADIGIHDGRIAIIGHNLELPAQRIIQAEERVVAPGFIDMHSHSDISIIDDPLNSPKIMQGITTELIGQDGFSVAPVIGKNKNILFRQVPWFENSSGYDEQWSSYSEYIEMIKKTQPSVNLIGLIGHGTVRMAVMGMEDREAKSQELCEMKELIKESMDQGCIGLSSGLVFPPCSYASKSELIEICTTVAEKNGILVVHMRNESNYLLQAIKELIEISMASGVSLHLSHFKVLGKQNWGKSESSLQLIEQARKEGLDVTFDQYPYLASNTTLLSLLPPSVQNKGPDQVLSRIVNLNTRKKIKDEILTGEEWENQIKIVGWRNIILNYVKSAAMKNLIGKNFEEIASEFKTDPADALMDILVSEDLVGSVIVFYGDEGDLNKILVHPLQMVGTDGLLKGLPHPRVYGTYPRLLGEFVREKRLLSLEQAIRKMTSFPAQRLRLKNRGLLIEGAWADIVIFDPQTIKDNATYQFPENYPTGIDYVLVNGMITIEQGLHNNTRAGKFIEKGN